MDENILRIIVFIIGIIYFLYKNLGGSKKRKKRKQQPRQPSKAAGERARTDKDARRADSRSDFEERWEQMQDRMEQLDEQKGQRLDQERSSTYPQQDSYSGYEEQQPGKEGEEVVEEGKRHRQLAQPDDQYTPIEDLNTDTDQMYTSVEDIELKDADGTYKPTNLDEEEQQLSDLFREREERLKKERDTEYELTHSRAPRKVKSYEASIYKEYRKKKHRGSKYRKMLQRNEGARDAFVLSEILGGPYRDAPDRF